MMSTLPRLLLLALMAATPLLLAQPAAARTSVAVVDQATLARVEDALSTPICGVGYLDTRKGQLEGIVTTHHEAYLEAMVRGSYGKDKGSLPQLAVQLLGMRKTATARKLLRQLVGDATLTDLLREVAARNLATKYRDPAGRDILLAGLTAPGVQRRADSFSALLPVMRPKDVDAIVSLASDPDFYAVDRLVRELETKPALKRTVLSRLDKQLKTAKGDEAGRMAGTATLLGASKHLARAAGWLTSSPGVATDDELRQRGQLAHALAAEGHREGLDAALHLVSNYRGPEPAMWKRYVLGAFFQFTDAPAEWRQREPAAVLPLLSSFWKRNRDQVRFNRTTKRFE